MSFVCIIIIIIIIIIIRYDTMGRPRGLLGGELGHRSLPPGHI